MRRKTDFFSNENASVAKVQDSMEKHIALYREDKKRQELVKQKQAEEKAKKEAAKKAAEAESGATVEEIDDEEDMFAFNDNKSFAGGLLYTMLFKSNFLGTGFFSP